MPHLNVVYARSHTPGGLLIRARDPFGRWSHCAILTDAGTAIEALASPDARTVSVSRSTLARAALTFQAIDGTLKIEPDTEVKSPVLYSIRGDRGADSIYAQVESRQPIDYNAIAGRKVTYQVTVAETGNVATVELDAAEATQDIDDRIDNLMKLRDCLRKGRR